MFNIILMILYILLTVSGLIIFKLGTDTSQISYLNEGLLNIHISILSIIGIVCYGCSFIIYLTLISKNTLSYLVPLMTGIVYILVIITSVLILKEKVGIISIIGCIFILIGVLIIMFQNK